VETLGLRGKLNLEQLNFLFHGGSLTQSTGRENTARIAEMYRLFPLLRLLGGCLPDQMLTGSLHVWRGVLLCEENRQTLEQILPKEFDLPAEPLRPAHAYMSGYQYTRSEAEKSAPGLLPEKAGKGSDSLMIFSGQAIMRGSMFLHGFTLLHPSTLEIGCLLHSLALWSRHGTVGGQSSRGHGRLKTWLLGQDDSRTEAIEAYLIHVQETKQDAVAWLDEAFAARPTKSKEKKTKPQSDSIDFFHEMTK
jgi:hypothetical protein